MDQSAFITLITVLLAALSPLVLKYAPAKWKGQPMAIGAIVVSLILGGVDLEVTGQLAHFDWQTATLTLVAYVGAQQGIFALFKDSLKLPDPPVAAAPGKPAPAV